jgi:hypothetical protein
LVIVGHGVESFWDEMPLGYAPSDNSPHGNKALRHIQVPHVFHRQSGLKLNSDNDARDRQPTPDRDEPGSSQMLGWQLYSFNGLLGFRPSITL